MAIEKTDKHVVVIGKSGEAEIWHDAMKAYERFAASMGKKVYKVCDTREEALETVKQLIKGK
jgi:DNA-binding transcriptional regulator/RsmH inhibitor MraZ